MLWRAGLGWVGADQLQIIISLDSQSQNDSQKNGLGYRS